ncbi:MAG: ferrous iron transport protein B [Candidatus Omnitrophica bacterium]|nr:ferrous iron transport protein B [Candidatus Omnitrophota bacterium]
MPAEIFPTQPASLIKTVALVGNPNSGKTTLFNAFTKLRQKVGNYPGVTVEKKTGTLVLANDRVVNVVDLPGTYSLAVRSPDEQIVRNVLLGRAAGEPRPDMVVCVVDAGNLERNLYLFSQIQDLGLPIIVALNMMDEVESRGQTIDVDQLSRRLGVPVVPTVGNQNKGIEELKQLIAGNVTANYQRQWRMAPDLEEEVEHLVRLLEQHENMDSHQAFAEALILISLGSKLKNDEKSSPLKYFFKEELIGQINAVQDRLRAKGLRSRTAAIEARYDWIKSILKDCVRDKARKGPDLTERIDAVLVHKLWGWLFFLGIMGLMFYTIFTIATYPMEWINAGFNWLGDQVRSFLPAGPLRDLFADGVIPGVGGVVIFLPQILILFLFIGMLQDTGYMARAAFIMDRVMSKVGLHGKSFIPLLSSFACAIPGIMSTRTIESPKDRLVTILVAPWMSCSARLPVYTIMIAVLMPSANNWQKAGLMLLMYVIGIVSACGMAWVFKKTLLRSQKPVFIMELPPYRLPSGKAVVIHMWERSRLFLRRAGTVILAMSVILWALMSYPKSPAAVDSAQAVKHSFAGRMGTVLEPAIQPLGYDWRIGIGLIGSFAAREVFVSTMSIVFNIGKETQEDTLRGAFQSARWPDGRPLFTPLVCLSLMVFYVFALQCVSTIAIVHRETNSWRWPIFQFLYMAAVAYLAAFLVYQAGRLFGFS